MSAARNLNDNSIISNTDSVLERIRRADAREGLLDFTKYTKSDYIVNWHHELICNEVDDFLADPSRNRLMLFVGPRNGKSEIISRRLPAYYLGRYPDKEVIATSYGADLAQAMSRDVQRVIETERYRELFPDTRLSSVNVKTASKKNYVKTADKFEIVGHQGVYKCAGIGGALTGFGADLAIVDDPIKDMQEASSPKRKQVIFEWYQSVLTTRLVGEEKVIIILTRWAEDDLAGRLLKEAKTNSDADQWEVISLPTLFDEDHTYKHPLDPRMKNGEPLWPQKMDENKARKRKVSVGSKVWSSLYQQNPTPAGGTIFKTSWFRYYKEMPKFDYKVASWDFTFKDTSTADYVVGGVWGIHGPNKYLIYMVRDKMDFVKSIKAMVNLNTLYPDLRYNLVEDKANGPAIISALKEKISGILAYNPNVGKEARANATSPQYEAHNVLLPDMYYEPNRTRHAWAEEETDKKDKLLTHYIAEHKGFPFAPNDDCVDMTTQILLKLGGGMNWLEELIKDDVNTKPKDEYIEKIAELMNWDTSTWGG